MTKIKNDVKETVETKVDKEIKDIYDEEVIWMYEEYNPTTYERRYDDDGFGDIDNWVSNVKSRGNEISYKMRNEAKAENSRYRLDRIIEQGVYDWDKHPEERPVYERTMERIKRGKVVENTLEKELKRKGYEFTK